MAKTENKPAKVAGSKHFKLGTQASLFVDSYTKKKVAGNQVIEFTADEQRSPRFIEAKRNGHLVEAETEDIENKDDSSQQIEKFTSLPGKEAKVKYLCDEYEVTDEEKIELMKLDDNQLLAKFKEYEDIDN